mmetsp:Transcript_79662/g.159056  ORF Transcript_79662/g.159056 Transcript_79662/m.159056 type:complete len:221 (-) Transcript_79662:238-900(-)
MQPVLRQRRPAQDLDGADDDTHTLLDMAPRDKRSPSANQLLSEGAPQMSGVLLKRSRPFLGLLPRCCPDAWRERFFILSGRYLFRFTTSEGEKPKGVPLPVEICSVRRSTAADDEDGGNGTDREETFGFVISTIRKEYHLRAASEEERQAWIMALDNAKHRAIKEGMGHAKVDPRHGAANEAGSWLFARRIKDDAKDGGTQELSFLSGGPGGVPPSSSFI